MYACSSSVARSRRTRKKLESSLALVCRLSFDYIGQCDRGSVGDAPNSIPEFWEVRIAACELERKVQSIIVVIRILTARGLRRVPFRASEALNADGWELNRRSAYDLASPASSAI